MTSVTFRLDIHDDWPPIAAECVPCERDGSGYRILAPPIFVKDLSVGDVISITEQDNGQIFEWSHIVRSHSSTVWLMLSGAVNVEEHVSKLRGYGCNTCKFSAGPTIYSVDVPEHVSVDTLDTCLSDLTPEDVAVAYPSWRHEWRVSANSSLECDARNARLRR